MSLLDELNEAVRKNLPSHLSDELKKALDERASLQSALKDQKTENEWCKSKIGDLESRERKIAEGNAVFAKLEKTQSDVDAKLLRAEIFELKASNAEQRVKDAKDIVLAVFGNSKFKYSESGYAPVGVPVGGFVNSGSTNKTIETEG